MKKLSAKSSIVGIILLLALLPQFISYAARFFQVPETGWVVWEKETFPLTRCKDRSGGDLRRSMLDGVGHPRRASELSLVIDNVQDADIILKSGRIIEAKAYVWSDLPTNEAIQDIIFNKDMNQIARRLEIHGPDTSIEVVFQGSRPNLDQYPFAARLIEGYESFTKEGYKVRWRFYDE